MCGWGGGREREREREGEGEREIISLVYKVHTLGTEQSCILTDSTAECKKDNMTRSKNVEHTL